jgi:transposase
VCARRVRRGTGEVAHPHRRPVTPPPPKVRQSASWLLRHPTSLDTEEQATLAGIRAACHHLAALPAHATEFAEMMAGRRGQQLIVWIAAVAADDQPDLHSFTAGIKHDHDAVLNGLTLPHTSGAIEGRPNHIKINKRQGHGRAKLDLFRERDLLTT